MISNREVSRLFSLYAELLLLHRQDERLAVLLSGAAYRVRRMENEITELGKKELSKLFRPQVVAVLIKLQSKGTIDELDELIQLTPAGLFEMMRLRGLGGKKLSVLWQTAGIDSVEALLEACKNNRLSSIPRIWSQDTGKYHQRYRSV